MNNKLLKETIDKSGLKKKVIAEKIGIAPYTLQLKLDNKRKFYVDEVVKLCTLLSLNSEIREEIFFMNCVENISTNGKGN